MASRQKSPRASPRRPSPALSGNKSPSRAKTPTKENPILSPSLSSQQLKRPRESDEMKYQLRQLKMPPATYDMNQLTPTLRSPQKSPARSPKASPRRSRKNSGNDLLQVPGQENGKSQPEVEYEEEFRFYQYSHDKTKAYWFLPLKKLVLNHKKEIRLLSKPFPKDHSRKWRFCLEMNKEEFKLTKLFVGIEAILNDKENKNPDWKRECHLDFRIALKNNNNFDIDKGFHRTFSSKVVDTGFIHQEKALQEVNLAINDVLIIELTIKQSKNSRNTNSEFLGLVNAGNTCYMNSFLQTLYHLSAFARIVYKVPFSTDRSNAISASLQKLFYNLKYGKKPVPTTELIKSFGWDKRQAWVQQDVSEFCTLLLEALEKKMSHHDEVEGAINELFEGQILNYVDCLNVDYTSQRTEKFLEVQLMVKGMTSIYDSLEYFVGEETLEGDNQYDAELHGKQDAKKGMRFQKLPAVLMLHLKRFEYDYVKNKEIKITDRCEFYDEIDMKDFVVKKYKKSTEYKLFSVLVHNGSGTGSGHYYAFIRPRNGEKWYKFNDDMVDTAEPEEVFEANFGGVHQEARLNREKEIEITDVQNPGNAYMLVYIRKNDISDYLKEIENDEVPRELIEEIEKNKKVEEERRKKGEEFFKIYITSFELLKGMDSPGLAFYKMNNKDDQYQTRFMKNKQRRLKVYFRKNSKVIDLLKFISENTGIPQEELMIWKMTIAKEQLGQVLKRNFLNSTGPNVQVLSNGVNSHQLKSIFFVHPIDRKKYPAIFKQVDKYTSAFNDIACKNALEFAVYQADSQALNGSSNLTNSSMMTQNSDSTSTKADKLLEVAGPTFIDLLDEKMSVVFLKKYVCHSGNPRIELLDYMLVNITDTVDLMKGQIEQDHPDIDMSKAKLFIEDKKRYTLEPLQNEETISKISGESGFVCVIEPQDESTEKMDYISATEHYEILSRRVQVNFISDNGSFKTVLDGGMSYQDITKFVSANIYEDEIPSNKIILKAKWKNNLHFYEVPYTTDQILSHLVKHDERVYCQASKIEVDQLDKKLKVVVCFYSSVTNNATREEELFLDKNVKVQALIDEIQNKKLFEGERSIDISAYGDDAPLKLMLIDKKKHKLIGKAANDTNLSPYVTKYRLRVEYIPKKYEDDEQSENRQFFPVYSFHATRDGELFSYPFVFYTSKQSAEDIKATLYQHIKEHEIWGAQKIDMTEEYFSKLKFLFKDSVNDSKHSKLEDETFPFLDLDSDATKFTLEIIHNFNMVTYQQMKIQTTLE